MKKLSQKIILILSVTLLFASCSKTPEACFTVDKLKTAKVNEEVQFNASCSKDADTYSWDFGDGNVGSGSTTKHKYPNAGDYTVKLTASNKKKSVTNSQTVTINP